jgi:hypothetical protein
MDKPSPPSDDILRKPIGEMTRDGLLRDNRQNVTKKKQKYGVWI